MTNNDKQRQTATNNEKQRPTTTIGEQTVNYIVLYLQFLDY